jgi:hypothetical protein
MQNNESASFFTQVNCSSSHNKRYSDHYQVPPSYHRLQMTSHEDIYATTSGMYRSSISSSMPWPLQTSMSTSYYLTPERYIEASYPGSPLDGVFNSTQQFLDESFSKSQDPYDETLTDRPIHALPLSPQEELESIYTNHDNENICHYPNDNAYSLNGMAQYTFVRENPAEKKKRQRRCPHEIERKYHCTWSGCTKAYGTLSHLNTHIKLQQHGNIKTSMDFVKGK